MSTVKISQLDTSSNINANPSQSLFVTTDLNTNQTTSLSARALGDSLYSNNALVVGSGGVLLANAVAQYTGIGGSYVQVSAQNLNANGSVDYVLTADTGTDSSSFLDLGLNNSTFSDPDFSAMKALDGYLFVQGPAPISNTGNLVIGTASLGANIVFAVGGTTATNIVGRVSTSGWEFGRGAKVSGNVTVNAGGSYVFADSTVQSTAAAPAGYTQAAFNQANSVNTYARSANTFLQAYAAANDIITLSSAQSYTDSANSYIQSHYLANANTTLDGSLTVLGSIKFADGSIQYLPSASPTSFLVTSNSAIELQSNNHTYTFGNNGVTNLPGELDVGGNIFVANATYDYTNVALVRIVGSSGAHFQPPSNPGYMLSITGVDGVSSRVVNTTYGTGAYALYAGRKANGTAGAPTAVANNDVIARYSSSGYNGSSFTSTGQGRIDFVADEDFTVANTGSRIEFYNIIKKSNTITKIATFNANSVSFTGHVMPAKGVVYSPRLPAGVQTAITIDYTSDSIIKANCAADLVISHSNFVSGKVVEVWLTNSSGINHTITHGCSAINSTTNSTTFTLPSTSSAYLKFFSIYGDLANTFVTAAHA